MPRPTHLLCLVAVLSTGAGCYAGKRANADVNDAWRGRTRSQIEARWGKPAAVTTDRGETTLRWTRRHRRFSLPSGGGGLTLDEGGFDAHATIRPGRSWSYSTDVTATVGADGRITRVEGRSLYRGAPPDANIRWGTLFGMHAGVGRLDDTSNPLPSGGMYIGGMLTRTSGLVGAFSLISGTDDAGGAMGFVWALGVQWWADARFSVRAGPATVLAFDPGFENVGFDVGVNGSLSYALIRNRVFVLDVRADVTQARHVTLGSVGIGVNLN